MTALERINAYNRAENEQSNFRNLWQDTSNYCYPLMNQITTQSSAGTVKPTIYDSTAVMESESAASGIIGAAIPPSQRFFELQASRDDLNNLDSVKRYLSIATDITHGELFKSNFLLQIYETVRSLIVFGTGCIYSEYGLQVSKGKKRPSVDTPLNFCDYPIGTYVIYENDKGIVDGISLKFTYTARQAVQRWGQDAVGEKIRTAANDSKTSENKFTFIETVRPREERNGEDSLNMSFGYLVDNVEEKLNVEEDGYEEFPYSVCRWMKGSNEIHGRGQGTEILPEVKVLNAMKRDLIECADKHNDPPLEVIDTFEGEVKTFKGAVNYVPATGSIQALNPNVQGNFVITEKILDIQTKVVKDAFYADVFNQLSNLTGDRRTTVEIRARLTEGLKKLGKPIARLYGELFNTLIPRCVKILIRHGIIPPPPPELQGQGFDIKYVGPLALALRNQQAQGFVEWLNVVIAAEPVAAGSMDIVNLDEGLKDLARSYGVKETNIATPDQIKQKRDVRAAQLKLQQEQMALETAGKTYKDTSGAAEKGSPAGALMDALNGK